MSRSISPQVSRLAVSSYFLCCGLIFSTWASRIPATKDFFNLNEAKLGTVLFMLPFGSLVALPVAGWSVHRLGSRWMTLVSAIGYALLLMAIGYCTRIWQLSLVLFFFGFLGDILNIAMNTQGLGVQKRMNRPILSSMHGLWSLGALCGAVIGGWTMRRGWSTTEHFTWVAAVIILTALAICAFLITEEPKAAGTQKLFTRPGRALLLLGLICFCTAMCEGAMADWSSLYYRQVQDSPGKVSTTGYTAFTFAMAIGRLVGDRFIQRLRYRKTLMLNGLLIAAGLGLALGIQLPVAVIIGYAMVGLGVSSVIPIVYMIAGKSTVMAPAAALAAVSTIGFTGFLFGPPLIGFIAQEVGLRLALLTVLVLGLVITYFSGKAVRD
jgi:MFS family permease